MFNLNDRVVYPGHGVARITQIISKVMGGKQTSFYELRFINKDMTILVPVTAKSTIRPLTPENRVNAIFEFLAQPARRSSIPDVTTNWKQRNKDYQTKLRTGNLMDISAIYRELKHIGQHKELSFCEKHLLVQTEMLLAEELALIQHTGEEKVVQHLRSIFTHVMNNNATKAVQKSV